MTLTIVAFASSLVAAIVLFLGSRYTSALRAPVLLTSTAFVVVAYGAVLALRPPGLLISNGAVLVVALLLGSSLGTLFNGHVGLISFLVAAAVADVCSYLGGVTAALSHAFQHGSNLLPYLCLSFPVHGRLRPVVGIGDLVVITAVYLALRRLGHNGLLAFTGPFAGLALALAIGLLIGGVFAIPFIAATSSAYLWFVRARPPSSAPSSAREAPTGGHA